jgi:hypothetical protein
MRAFLFFLVFPLACSAGQLDTLDWAGLQRTLSEQGLCLTSKAAELCRRLPWPPRLHEGVAEVNGVAVVVIDAEVPAVSQLARWQKQFPLNLQDEMTAYFSIANEDFALGLEKSFHPSVVLVRVAKRGDTQVIRSVSFFDSYSLRAEVLKQFKIVQGEINESRGEWIPPLSFTMSHEYRFIQ